MEFEIEQQLEQTLANTKDIAENTENISQDHSERANEELPNLECCNLTSSNISKDCVNSNEYRTNMEVLLYSGFSKNEMEVKRTTDGKLECGKDDEKKTRTEIITVFENDDKVENRKKTEVLCIKNESGDKSMIKTDKVFDNNDKEKKLKTKTDITVFDNDDKNGNRKKTEFDKFDKNETDDKSMTETETEVFESDDKDEKSTITGVINEVNKPAITERQIGDSNNNNEKPRTNSQHIPQNDDQFYTSLRDERLKLQNMERTESAAKSPRRKFSFTLRNKQSDKVQTSEGKVSLSEQYGIHEEALDTEVGEWVIVDVNNSIYEKQQASEITYLRRISKRKRLWLCCLSIF